MVPIEYPIAMSSSVKSQIKRWLGSQTFISIIWAISWKGSIEGNLIRPKRFQKIKNSRKKE